MNTRRRSAIQALLWGGYVAISLVMMASFQPLSGALVFVMVCVGLGLWACSEALRALTLRCGWLDGAPRALLLRLLLLTPLFSVLLQAVIFVISRGGAALGLLHFPPQMPQGWLVLLSYAVNCSILLWLWLAVWVGVTMVSRWRLGEIAKWKAETAARELELQVLRAQINPHFLFNALNNLRALINEDPTRAREMLSRLSNTLRHTLQHSAKERVPLADELAVVRDYVALEQLHHEERLRVDWQVDPATAGASVPPMLLQLLVENAIKHGIACTAGGGVVDIRIARAGDKLQIAVDNPGQWKPEPGAPDSTGVGLVHLRERLARAGGTGAGCRIDAADGRVNVTVELAA
ncbi:sensor histidine kinase [Roseateles sp. LYH14W]|uniref:Sensor histidine kinase n=1 Tax=Pelomonas parva TaxID=3299032 RepID=A0ABW7F0B6_9BURK